MILYIIGTNKQAKKHSQCRIVSGKNNITIGAGNIFKHPANLVLIANLYENHIDKFHTVPQGTLVWVPNKAFISILQKKNSRVKLNIIRPGRTTKYKKFYITPFQVPYSKTSKTYGFRIETEGKKIVWIQNFKNLIGTSKYLRNLDHLFISMISQKIMKWFKSQDLHPKKIFSIINKNKSKDNINLVQKSFSDFKINKVYDGQIIHL